MGEYYFTRDPEDYVAHHGVLGMKWGIRRYQNPDGSLTSAGREKYGDGTGSARFLKSGHSKHGSMYGNSVDNLKNVGKSAKKVHELKAKRKNESLMKIAERKNGKKVSATTKRVINDYDHLSDQEFMNRYKVSKKRYAKRVKRYGDPYMNGTLAKLAKQYNKKQAERKAAGKGDDLLTWSAKWSMNHVWGKKLGVKKKKK